MVAYHSKCLGDPTHKSSTSPPMTIWFSQTDYLSESDKLSSISTKYPMLPTTIAITSM